MSGKSLKLNVIARSVVSVVELAFSLFCFPYVARILSPESLGQIDFVNSTIAYFVTLGTFGIAEYGVRAVAQNKSNLPKLDEILSNLMHLRILLAIVLFAVYLLIVIPFFGNGSALFLYSSLLIFTSCFNIIWALEGLEDFSYLAFAKIFSKGLFVIFLLFFINEDAHAGRYFLGVIFFDFLYFIFCFLRLKSKYSLQFGLKTFFSKPYFGILPSLFHLFILVLLQSSIAGIPSLFMGKLDLLASLGQYSVAQRFFWIGFYAIIPLSTVLLSRSMSYTDSNEEKKGHLDLTASSLFALCFPVTAGLIAISGDLIPLFVGDKYEEAIVLLKLLAFLISIFTINNFWSMQVVFSNNGDKSLVKSNVIGLSSMLVFCFLFIPKLEALGATYAVLSTHIVLFLVFYYFGRKFYRMNLIIGDVIKSLLAAVIMYSLIFSIEAKSFTYLGLKITIGIFAYFIALFVLNHKLFKGHLKQVLKLK